MTVLCPSCVAKTTSARNWHTSQENMNVFKEELPAFLAVCIELGNREDDPTDGIQSLSLTLNSKHSLHENTSNLRSGHSGASPGQKCNIVAPTDGAPGGTGAERASRTPSLGQRYGESPAGRLTPSL